MRLARTLLEDHVLDLVFDAFPMEPNLQFRIVVRVIHQDMPSPPPVLAAASGTNADELNLAVVKQLQCARRHHGSSITALVKRQVKEFINKSRFRWKFPCRDVRSHTIRATCSNCNHAMLCNHGSTTTRSAWPVLGDGCRQTGDASTDQPKRPSHRA